MESRFFSVIIPVYNAASTLDLAVESVLRQSFADLQLILVDDGSTDKSLRMLKKYAKRDPRVSVCPMGKNRGLSAARNEGLRHATGRYIHFMDADDALEETFYQSAFNALSEFECDAVVFGVTEEYVNGVGDTAYQKRIMPEPARLLGSASVRSAVLSLEERTLFGYAWNKVYRAESLRQSGLVFEDVALIEDFLFNIAFFEGAESIMTLETAPYHYRIRSGQNLTARFVPEYFPLHARRISTLYDALKRWGLLNEAALQSLAARYARYLFSALVRNGDPRAGMDAAARRAWLKAVYHDPLFALLRPHMTFSMSPSGLLSGLIRGGWTPMLLCAARFTGFTKHRLPAAFSRLKQSR